MRGLAYGFAGAGSNIAGGMFGAFLDGRSYGWGDALSDGAWGFAGGVGGAGAAAAATKLFKHIKNVKWQKANEAKHLPEELQDTVECADPDILVTSPVSALGDDVVGDLVDLSTKGRSSEEAASVTQYARRSNIWLAENGPQTIVSTAGPLRKSANVAVRHEKQRAARAGTPYSGQAGHVPDTAITGSATPPAGWLDMPGYSNQIAGGVLSSRVGTVIQGFTVDGVVPD